MLCSGVLAADAGATHAARRVTLQTIARGICCAIPSFDLVLYAPRAYSKCAPIDSATFGRLTFS